MGQAQDESSLEDRLRRASDDLVEIVRTVGRLEGTDTLLDGYLNDTRSRLRKGWIGMGLVALGTFIAAVLLGRPGSLPFFLAGALAPMLAWWYWSIRPLRAFELSLLQLRSSVSASLEGRLALASVVDEALERLLWKVGELEEESDLADDLDDEDDDEEEDLPDCPPVTDPAIVAKLNNIEQDAIERVRARREQREQEF